MPAGGGRSIFALPWLGRTLLGTTDNDYEGDLDATHHVPPSDEDVAYLLDATNEYFGTALGAGDLTGAYAGVRPLITSGDPKKSVDISRKAELYETSSGMVTITGGKLTTWRRMAKMTVDRLVEREARDAPCRTHEIPLGASVDPAALPRVEGVPEAAYAALAGRYGHAAHEVLAVARERAELAAPIVVRAARPARRGRLRGPLRAGADDRRRAAAAHAAGPARGPRAGRRRPGRARASGRRSRPSSAGTKPSCAASSRRGRTSRAPKASSAPRNFATPRRFQRPDAPTSCSSPSCSRSSPRSPRPARWRPGPRRPAFFAGDAIDGPSPDIRSLGDLDLARDGTGALTYVKRIDGVDHVVAARFEGGVFQAPEPTRRGACRARARSRSSAPPTAGGSSSCSPAAASSTASCGPPARAGRSRRRSGAGSDPAVDLSINGTAYASFTSAQDVRVARLDRRTNAWGLIEQPADADPARAAGVGAGRSRVAISADGVGVVTWGEAGHVYARKMFGAGLSTAPQDLTPASFEDRVAAVSDLPVIDAEDDSSYAWVAFRQRFADGGTRILARRQRGTSFDPPVAVDEPGGEPVAEPRIDLNGRGVAVAATTGTQTGQAMMAITDRDVFGAGGRLFAPSVVAPSVVPAIAENNDGLIGAVLGVAGESPYVRVRTIDDRKLGPEQVLSRPELGSVVPQLGFDVATDRASGAIVAWVQGGADGPPHRRGLSRSAARLLRRLHVAALLPAGAGEAELAARVQPLGAGALRRDGGRQAGGGDRRHLAAAHDAAGHGRAPLAGRRLRRPRPEQARPHAQHARRRSRAVAGGELPPQGARRPALGARA